MRALSVHQPFASSITQPHAYLAGVLLGDGFFTRPGKHAIRGYLGLRVKDLDFANAFAAAVRIAYGVNCNPRLDERGYWLVKRFNGHGRFDELRSYEPTTDDERATWLRGYFDSEGNANLVPRPKKGPGSFSRRVSFYSTNAVTLDAAAAYLACLGLSTRRTFVRPSAGHLGTRPVEELALRSSREAYLTFAVRIGSSIERKRLVLDAIPESYTTDRPAALRRAQLLGAATKRRQRMARRIEILTQIRSLATRGVRPTDELMSAQIPGYLTQRKYYTTKQLVGMACAL